MAVKCPSCGANVSENDKECSYCGTSKPDYRSPDKEVLLMLTEGIEAFRREQHAAAIRSFLQVIDLAPDCFEAYFYLSASLTALDCPKEAIQYMERAQKLRPGSAPVYYNLAVLCQKIGRQNDAKKYFKKALLMAKTDPDLADREEFKRRIQLEGKKFHHWKLF